MKKTLLSILILLFLVLSLGGVSYGWLGRMAGMGDPFGLVEDESDFLIHPAGIANGKGINFYGNYRYTFNDVNDWNITLTQFNPRGAAIYFVTTWGYPMGAEGDENRHEALLGAALPIGPGRMGLFFEYSEKNADFSGRGAETFALFLSSPFQYFDRFSMDSDLDAFAMRLLYGLPMGAFKLGGEIQLAYRKEQNKTFFNIDYGRGNSPVYINDALNSALTRYMIPYDSKFWEILFKGSVDGAIGQAKITFTAWGGFIFEGDNRYEVLNYNFSSRRGFFNDKGDVDGWRLGGDFWLRYPLADGLSLPFIARIDYQNKTRDGKGTGDIYGFTGVGDYKNEEKAFQIEVSGGLDKELTKGTKIAGGIYYAFLNNKTSFRDFITDGINFLLSDYKRYPYQTEHQVILRLSGEKEINPMFVMRAGLNFLYSWVKEDLRNNPKEYFRDNPWGFIDKISLGGHSWGIGAFLGGTVKVKPVVLELFLDGGYKRFDLSGNGFQTGTPSETGTPTFEWMDKLRKELFVGGGFSIKY